MFGIDRGPAYAANNMPRVTDPVLDRLASPPFSLRARLLTPLADGTTRYLADARIDVDAAGVLSRVGEWRTDGAAPTGRAGTDPDAGEVVDVRPLIVLPGLIDLHAHLPQWPN